MNVSLSDYVAGAGFATALVNTSSVVRSSGDVLVDPASLARFLDEHGVPSDALADGQQPTDDDLRRVLALRQTVRLILEEPSEEHAVVGAAALASAVSTSPGLRPDDGQWKWYVSTSPQADLAGELGVLIGIGLLGVIRTLSHDRFRPCASPVCNGVFVDTSRAGRRRFCMPEICGNRLNVANHRARRRATAT